MILLSVLLLIGSLFLIALVSDKIISYTLVLSKWLGFSEMAAGFILLSITTSLPELSVSILSSISGEGGLSVGNVLGSNIANLTIIIGLAVFLSKTAIHIKGESQKELVQFLFLSSVIPLFIVQRGSLGPVLGFVLLILFVYFSFTISKTPKQSQIAEQPDELTEKPVRAGLKFICCLLIIIFLSQLVVDSSLDIADFVNLPSSIIGATIIGVGTSIPELATTVQTLKKKYYEMALGNLLGSCITNITLVLGISSLVSFSEVNILAVESIMFYVLISSLTVWYMISSNKSINKKGAVFLCAIYAAFVLQQIGVSIFIF
ncbi:MAG: sodium:calcium antiporter [Candidatus Bathyarchaeota archaeon]|nr:sodium:calcium antiporter [Candidatus Bathyarchaeum sp.]